jgi:hypothetical protein
MGQKRRDLVSTFVAADETGRKLVISHYRESILQPPAEGGGWKPVKDVLVTEDGRDVKRMDKGVYQIVSTRGALTLKSDDPNAP